MELHTEIIGIAVAIYVITMSNINENVEICSGASYLMTFGVQTE